MGKVLFVATVVKTHIMQFHIPYLKMFKEMGWETAVAARNDYDDTNKCVIPYCDIYYDLSFARNPFKPANLKAYKLLKKIISDGRYDIIHCHTPVGGVIGRLAAKSARKNGTRVFYTAHGFHFFKGAPLLNWLLYYPVEKLCSRITDVLITINHEDYELALKKMKAKRVEYIPGVGIDTEKFAGTQVDRAAKRREIGVPENAFVLISVGELITRKNHQIVIKAVAEIGNKDLHYVIVGQGILKNQLQQLVEKLNVADRVHFLGYRTDVAELNKTSDVFCFPSTQEGLPVALMEAMACGLPVICSDIRGNTDLIEDGVGGYLFDSNNIDLLKSAILNICNGSMRAKNFEERNFNIISNFDFNNINQMMKKLYFSPPKEGEKI